MKKLVYSAYFILCFIFFSYAHPHMWFDSEFEIIFSDSKLQGVNIIWTFDKFFSSDIISGYDLNRDGVFSTKETDDVFQNAFTYTSNYGHFTFVRVGNKRKSPESILRKDFSASQKNGRLKYKFYVDLSSYNENEIYIACYDYTFFCDISYPKNPVKFIGTKSDPKYEIIENKNYPIYYDPFGSIDDTRVYYKWAPGLNTYYPLEIKLIF